jgi:hypothetical protein
MEGPLSRLRLRPGADVTLAGQLRHRLGLMIADGELDPGSPLPSVRALSRRLGVSVKLDAERPRFCGSLYPMQVLSVLREMCHVRVYELAGAAPTEPVKTHRGYRGAQNPDALDTPG